MAIHYQCVRCTECCRWPGRVELAESEIDALAAFLGFAPREFIERYTQLRSDRRGLALRDSADGSCVFLAGRDCRVQPVKPRQCREFPNGWNFPGFEKLCRAIPTQVPDQGGAPAADSASSPSFTQATSSV